MPTQTHSLMMWWNGIRSMIQMSWLWCACTLFSAQIFFYILHMNFDISRRDTYALWFVSIIMSVFMATHINIWLFCWMRTPSSWYSQKSNGCFDTTCNASNQSIVEAFSAPSCGQRTSQSKLLNWIPGLFFISRCIFFIKYKATKQNKRKQQLKVYYQIVITIWTEWFEAGVLLFNQSQLGSLHTQLASTMIFLAIL